MAALRQFHLAVLLVDEEVPGLLRLRLVARQDCRQAGLDLVLALEPWRQPVDLDVKVRAFFRGARDDQRGARLVDQDGIDLVDDGEVERALGPVGRV